MMKFKHIAFAGITALSFSQIAIAGGGYQQQSQGGMQSEQSAAPGVEESTIRQAQEKLGSNGHDVQADGVLGPKTQAALKEFQQKEGIQASGQLDQETLAALGVSEGSAGTGASSPSSSSSDASSEATGAPNPQSSSERTAEPPQS
jgi:peptidoglycan hydrolase-like protein with peptidoglycan-binding domain